jgi:hypothetical protein
MHTTEPTTEPQPMQAPDTIAQILTRRAEQIERADLTVMHLPGYGERGMVTVVRGRIGDDVPSLSITPVGTYGWRVEYAPRDYVDTYLLTLPDDDRMLMYVYGLMAAMPPAPF